MSGATPGHDAACVATWPALQDAMRNQASPEAWWLEQDRGCLIIDATQASPAASTDGVALGRWLRRLPAPIIARADDAIDEPWLAACDARSAALSDIARIVRNVQRAPQAAAMLVQVLRLCESLPVEGALQVESLAYATLQGGAEFRRWWEQRDTPRTSDQEPAQHSDSVQLERTADRLAIRLNRPHAYNALNVAMRDALVEAFDLVSADATIDMATVSGIGRCYSVGGDLSEFGDRPDPATAHQIRSLRNPALALLRCATRVEFQLHGACLGSGIELPAFGRRVTARRDAYFQLPELQMGLIPGSGGCVSLPRRIGRQRTALLALSGKRLDAGDARAWGLIDAIND